MISNICRSAKQAAKPNALAHGCADLPDGMRRYIHGLKKQSA